MGKTSLNITQPLIALMLIHTPWIYWRSGFRAESAPTTGLPPCRTSFEPQALAALFSSPWAPGHQPWRVGSAWPWRGSRWRRWFPWMPRQSCGSAPPTCCASPSVSGCLGGLVAVVAEMTIDQQRRGGNDTILGEKWESGGAWRGDANFKDHFWGA